MKTAQRQSAEQRFPSFSTHSKSFPVCMNDLQNKSSCADNYNNSKNCNGTTFHGLGLRTCFHFFLSTPLSSSTHLPVSLFVLLSLPFLPAPQTNGGGCVSIKSSIILPYISPSMILSLKISLLPSCHECAYKNVIQYLKIN